MTWALAVALVSTACLATVATAKWDVFRSGNLVLAMDGSLRPKALPQHLPAPVSVHARGRISTADGSPPAGLREVVAYVDRDLALDSAGLPACRSGAGYGLLTTEEAMRACAPSLVGSGVATVMISFPELDPIRVTSPLKLFYGGIKGGTTRIFLHAFITVPRPAAVVATVTIRKVRSGRFGMRAVVKVPVIAGGTGSVIEYAFVLGRRFSHRGTGKSYLLGSCSDGRADLKLAKVLFEDEAGDRTGDAISDTLSRPCVARG